MNDANASGGKDNITVVLFKLADDEAGGAKVSDTLSGTEVLPAQPSPPRDPSGDTVVIPRPQATGHRPQEPPPDTRHPTPPPMAARSRARWPLAAAVVLIIILAAGGGLYAASRELYFVGTDNNGLVTMYRGVPYDLPLGIKLYTEQYESSVPAKALPPRQRAAVLNHKLRSRGDAVDLLRSLERNEG